ncbi:hypothetical protein CLU79DRAFT_52451 [Phycomyces nitens]|nr:hypothetical protein CLU79DRAFT_52451 [Phycomyces nitens]
MSLHNVFLPTDSPVYRYNPPLEPGHFVFEESTESIHVCCADGNVVGFTHIQAESKNIISAKDFVNGYEIRNDVGQFGEMDEDDIEAGMSGVRVTKKRSEYNKVIRKRLRLRKVDYERIILNRV